MEKLTGQKLQTSLQEIGASYDHIVLTDDEIMEAIIQAKKKKEAILEQERIRLQEEENRKFYIESKWDIERTNGFYLYRAGQLFNGQFVLDKASKQIYNILCLYFSDDGGFESMAKMMGIKEPSLDKGIFLTGNTGTGKTWMMQLFSKNKKQSFRIIPAKKIANDFEANGSQAMEEYLNLYKNPINDFSCFLQPFSGLCIDDIGAEDIKTHFGNKTNVIGDLIENRYSKKITGISLHATTNFTADQIKNYYGERVASRLRECFNWIEYPGKDRRK